MQDNAERLKKFYRYWLPLYRIINKKMCADYRAAIPFLLQQVEISKDTTILDVGTGTGGLAGILSEYTSRITAIDFSTEMLSEARKTYGSRINFLNMAAHELDRFETASFDVVTAAYCLHDMNDEYRINVLEHMRRLARKKVIIFDLAKRVNIIALAVECLEGSYYKDYVKSIDAQLSTVFPRYEEIAATREMVLYICVV